MRVVVEDNFIPSQHRFIVYRLCPLGLALKETKMKCEYKK